MKITATLIDRLICLRDGQTMPASFLSKDLVDYLIEERVLSNISHGSKRALKVTDTNAFINALPGFDERLGNLDLLRNTLASENGSGQAARAGQAAETGNSKLKQTRSFPGFLVNSYVPIESELAGHEVVINPDEGSSLFLSDWQSFRIPSDVVVVGIENSENFRHIRRQKYLFDKCVGTERVLFVSRYPQSLDLRSWLMSIPNRYVHFGDFDLPGINIFLTEFQKHIGPRASFLIPDDIKERLSKGSKERFEDSYHKYKGIHSDDPDLQHLIDTILAVHRCYDQEGYII